MSESIQMTSANSATNEAQSPESQKPLLGERAALYATTSASGRQPTSKTGARRSVDSGQAGAEADDGAIRLKPKMTLLNGCTVIVGSIIGSGIFIAPKGVLLNTGSVNLSIVVWVLCGLY